MKHHLLNLSAEWLQSIPLVASKGKAKVQGGESRSSGGTGDHGVSDGGGARRYLRSEPEGISSGWVVAANGVERNGMPGIVADEEEAATASPLAEIPHLADGVENRGVEKQEGLDSNGSLGRRMAVLEAKESSSGIPIFEVRKYTGLTTEGEGSSATREGGGLEDVVDIRLTSGSTGGDQRVAFVGSLSVMRKSAGLEASILESASLSHIGGLGLEGDLAAADVSNPGWPVPVPRFVAGIARAFHQSRGLNLK